MTVYRSTQSMAHDREAPLQQRRRIVIAERLSRQEVVTVEVRPPVVHPPIFLEAVRDFARRRRSAS